MHMTRILGLDMGTNSIGWAVVDTENNKEFELIEKGVRIFQEGLTAKERTMKRGMHRLLFRRRQRKIDTLKLLSKNGYCPPVSDEELAIWKLKKEFPVGNEDFLAWLRTDNIGTKNDRQKQIRNPYYYRFKAVNEPISKYEVGRAIYHLAQRRGFLSNSLTSESDELIVLITNKIRLKLEEATDRISLIKEIEDLISQISDEILEDTKVKKLIKSIEKIKKERGFIDELNKIINKKENLGTVKEEIEQLSKEIEKSGHKYLGEYLYFLYKSHPNIVNNHQSKKQFNAFVHKFKTEEDSESDVELTNKIRDRYIHREKHYLKEFLQLCKVQGINSIKTKNGRTLKEELEAVLFLVRPLKSQKGTIGKCTMEKNKPRCPLSHPIYEEFRMWQFINNIKYREVGNPNGIFKNLTYNDKVKIAPLFMKATNFKFNDIIKVIDPTYTKFEFSHQKRFEENRKDSLTVEASPTIGRLTSIFNRNWEDLKKERFKYKTIDRNGKRVEREIDILEIWQILYRSKYTNNRKNYLKDFAEEKLNLNSRKAEQFQSLATKLKEGYAKLSLKAIKNILTFMKPKDENSQVFIYSLAVFFANIQTVLGEKIWLNNKNKIINEIIDKLENQQEINQKNAFVNSLVRHFFNQSEDKRHYGYDNYQLDRSDIEHIELMASEFFGTVTWEMKSDDFKQSLLNFAHNEYQTFLRKVRINGNKSEYFKTVPRKDVVIKEYLATYLEQLSISEFQKQFNIYKDYYTKDDMVSEQLSKLYHPSDIKLYPDAKMVFDQDGIEALKLPNPYLPDIKNPVANRTLHKLKGLIEQLVNSGIIDERTTIHLEVAKEVNGANLRNAIQEYQSEMRAENENYSKLLEEFEKPINKENTEKVVAWRDQVENEVAFDEDVQKFVKLKDSKSKLNVQQKKELDILKKRLWNEQKGICLYSGKSISMKQLFSDGVIEIEHTFPRSRVPDNSLENKTIAFREENRAKGNKIPFELGEEKFKSIKGRLYFWEQKIKRLKQDYKKLEDHVNSGVFSTPEKRDAAVQKKFLKKMQLEYWTNRNGTGKYDRFIAKEITKRFKNSQLNDTRIITKYASEYLKTYFKKKPFVFQGSLVDTFRKEWGIQKHDEKKVRSKHIHHTIDAITIACMSFRFREILLKDHYAKIEKRQKSFLPRPFPEFENIIRNHIEQEVIVENETKDQVIKLTRKKLRHRGAILHKEIYAKDSKGNILKDKRNEKVVEKKLYRYKKGKRIPTSVLDSLVEGKDYFVETKKAGEAYCYEFVYDKNSKRVKELVPKYALGSTARAKLHEDSYYGAIKQFDKKDGKLQKNEKGEILLKKNKDGTDKIHYVIRKPLKYDSSGNKGFKNIDQLKKAKVVDAVVHEMLILQATETESFSKSFDIGYYMLKPIKKDKKVVRNQKGLIEFQKDENGNYVKGPKIKSIRVFSKLNDPIKLKRQTFSSQDQQKYKESFYVNNINNYLYVVYENTNNRGELKAVVISLFDFINNYRNKVHPHDKPYPLSIDVAKGNNKILYKIYQRNNKDVVLKKKMHVLFKATKDESIEDILRCANNDIHNRLYKIVGLNKNFEYNHDLKAYTREAEGQIKLWHHMISGEYDKNSQIEGMNDIFQKYFGKDKKLPESVSEFKIDYPFPFLLMSLNKMDCFFEGVDFKINILGQIEKI